MDTNSGAHVEIVGAGVVGTATGTALSSWGHEITYKELLPEKREQLAARGQKTVSPEDSVDADVSLVCVPTPYDSDAEKLDLSYVETAVERLAETAPSDRVVGIRSTVLPGTTTRLGTTYGFDHIAMIPEFLSAATAIEEAMAVENVIIGTESDHAHAHIESLFTTAPTDPTIIDPHPTEAELVKLMSNAYAATKVSFANEMWRIGETISDVSQDRILDVFRNVAPWVGNTRGLTGGWPYGGACLPKDTNGLSAWLDTRDTEAPQLDGTIAENEIMKQRDSQARTYGR